ncbi:hypothetical protein EXM22_04165 [Oceanispirochaeta crateris]|uniref:Uncharacterized protein n=1 Tax=Oceanispirochaeta crateris TaxID=2518645 RepID=A0A5C1QM43_9SPIO|nr:hypothetical protein [Oceanispirochaeta crateris]QEN07222.1 hypothetical protein EXM22_04165 [Oceanispirochaeta crateris]
MRVNRVRYLLIFLILASTISCKQERILVLSDPVFDLFASEQIFFYPVRKSIFFLTQGFIPEFLEYSSTEEYKDSVQVKLDSGQYGGIVTTYFNYHSFSLPENMKAVLIGGSKDIRYPGFSQIVSTDLEALRHLSSYLHSKWQEEGLIPLVVLWEEPGLNELTKEALLYSWKEEERHIMTDNWISFSASDGDRQNRLEAFFQKYDLDSQEYIVFGGAPLLFSEFFDALPRDEHLSLILTIPDNPVLPEGTKGIISPDYKNLIKESVRALKMDFQDDIREIENIFIKK